MKEAACAASFFKTWKREVRTTKGEQEIRFIDSRYHELFRIPDGASIEISYPDGRKEERECTFLDEYHTKVGSYVYHICEFAERMEAIGAAYQPVNHPVKDHTDTGRSVQKITGRGR